MLLNLKQLKSLLPYQKINLFSRQLKKPTINRALINQIKI